LELIRDWRIQHQHDQQPLLWVQTALQADSQHMSLVTSSVTSLVMSFLLGELLVNKRQWSKDAASRVVTTATAGLCDNLGDQKQCRKRHGCSFMVISILWTLWHIAELLSEFITGPLWNTRPVRLKRLQS